MHKQYRIGHLTTSKKEIVDLAKAWIVISLAFAVYITKFILHQPLLGSLFYFSIIVSALTVGTGFLVHEFAHKVLAQHYGCDAEFRSFDVMLIVALLGSFIGFIFAAPGAVFINGPVGVRRNGKISMAGPLTNLIFAAIFLAGLLLFSSGSLHFISVYGFSINTMLGLFNMIPFGIFDGSKIFAWNKTVYGVMVGAGVLFLVLQIVAQNKGWF
ncbi:metalloprotease [Candidatus Woesearchaeota archaeon]|nr:metalloprotease [Candidatus Woesearchaeota archaeon]